MANSSKKRSRSAPQRGRQKTRIKASIHHYTVPKSESETEDEDEPMESSTSRVDYHRHSQYSSGHTGNLSTRTSYFSLPKSPQKKSSTPRFQLNDDSAFVPEDIFEALEGDADVCDIEDTSHVVDPARKRIASVRMYLLCLCLKADRVTRTIR